MDSAGGGRDTRRQAPGLQAAAGRFSPSAETRGSYSQPRPHPALWSGRSVATHGLHPTEPPLLRIPWSNHTDDNSSPLVSTCPELSLKILAGSVLRKITLFFSLGKLSGGKDRKGWGDCPLCLSVSLFFQTQNARFSLQLQSSQLTPFFPEISPFLNSAHADLQAACEQLICKLLNL